MVVQHIDDDGQFEDAMQHASPTQLVICDFFAHWCPPCRAIAPVFEQLSNKYPDAVFLKINVDRCRMAAQLHGIRAMPTFIALINRQEVGRISGADSNGIERMIVANIKPTSSASAPASKNTAFAASKEERAWLEAIVQNSKRMDQYEDEIAQILALSLLSLEDLHAMSKVNGVVNQYEMAKNLMGWFHDSFFEWVDKPGCDVCKSPTTYVGYVEPSEQESAESAGCVELFQCMKCKLEVRFPRYQRAVKLLETRRGRCSEWANCFALFCRAVGFKPRWVMDNADHVWVEIWSDDLDRWVHLDPCENVIDTPLMYEKGWGKKYSYVFAFCIDHVRDVTWRYCYNHKTTMARRKSCREPVLRNFLNKLNARLSKNLSEEQKNQLTIIYMKELVEFLSPKLQLRDSSEAENHGRKSGEESWRRERGELAKSEAVIPQSVTIKPTKNELDAKCMIVNYDCSTDKYSRPQDSTANIDGWESLCFESKDVFRKMERDWKISYLCRKTGAASGFITWKIDLANTKPIRAIVSLGELTTFKTGQIMAVVCCDNCCAMIPQDTGSVVIDDVKGAEYLEVRVDFSGGDGECAWQHAQLFRGNCETPRDAMNLQVFFE